MFPDLGFLGSKKVKGHYVFFQLKIGASAAAFTGLDQYFVRGYALP
ncbi:hypothetical protein ACFS4T_22375 [Pseudomonas lini]